MLSEKYKDVRGDELKEKDLIDELQTHVKNTTAPYKTVSGKIRRTKQRGKETKQEKNL